MSQFSCSDQEDNVSDNRRGAGFEGGGDRELKLVCSVVNDGGKGNEEGEKETFSLEIVQDGKSKGRG